MAIRRTHHVLALAALGCQMLVTPASATEIQKLSVVEGRAEVIDEGALRIYDTYGITQVELMWPAKSVIDLHGQLIGAKSVKCLMFGDTTSVSCLAFDAFGSSWQLGGRKTFALTR